MPDHWQTATTQTGPQLERERIAAPSVKIASQAYLADMQVHTKQDVWRKYEPGDNRRRIDYMGEPAEKSIPCRGIVPWADQTAKRSSRLVMGWREEEPDEMINHTRLEWNAIIERLIESSGEDAEARAAIASLGATLRPMKGIVVDAGISLNADHVSGATPEQGNIEIDPGGTEKKSLRLGLGTVERIGYYKISRLRHKRFLSLPHEDFILINHHWKSDITTRSETEPPDAWCLCCDPQMEPVWFGRMAYRTVRWGWLSVVISEIQELWGPNPGTLHPIHMRLSLTTKD